MDIYQAMQQQGKYSALAIETEMNSCFSIFYNSEIILVAQKDGFYSFIPAMITMITIFGCKSCASCSEVKSKGCWEFEKPIRGQHQCYPLF